MHGKHIDIYHTDSNHHGFNYLGNVIQGNADSVNPVYYGHLDHLYKKVLGMGPIHVTKHTTIPAAVELYSTGLRDPVSYGIYKNIATHWMRYDTANYNCIIRDKIRGLKLFIKPTCRLP